MLTLRFTSVFVAAINIESVRLSGKMTLICTVGKVAALGVIIVGGFVKLGQGTPCLVSGLIGTSLRSEYLTNNHTSVII